MTNALIHSDDYARFDYGAEHPLRMERLDLTWRLMEAYGLTKLAGAVTKSPDPAEESELLRFHTEEYLAVLKAANTGRAPGGRGLPVRAGPRRQSCLSRVCGTWRGLAAGRLAARPPGWSPASEVRRAFHFAGGLHHAMPDRASGFCYVNDAVLAILHLRARGLRVAYVDIDAHHGDGVQAAFYCDPNVLTISTHERGDRLFPGTGFVEEMGEGEGRGYSVNLPLDVLTDSGVYLPAFEAVVPPLVRAFRPDVVVAQLGIDSHRTDPLTHLALDIQGFARAVAPDRRAGAPAGRPRRRRLRPRQRGPGLDGGLGGDERHRAVGRAAARPSSSVPAGSRVRARSALGPTGGRWTRTAAGWRRSTSPARWTRSSASSFLSMGCEIAAVVAPRVMGEVWRGAGAPPSKLQTCYSGGQRCQ